MPRKKAPKIELHHAVFGTVVATSAGRSDSGHFLICTTEDGYERKLLTPSVYWQAPDKVQTVFDELFAPIYAKNLKAMRKGERYDIGWRWRRGGSVRPVESDEPVELNAHRDALDDIVSLEDANDLAALALGQFAEVAA